MKLGYRTRVPTRRADPRHKPANEAVRPDLRPCRDPSLPAVPHNRLLACSFGQRVVIGKRRRQGFCGMRHAEATQFGAWNLVEGGSPALEDRSATAAICVSTTVALVFRALSHSTSPQSCGKNGYARLMPTTRRSAPASNATSGAMGFARTSALNRPTPMDSQPSQKLASNVFRCAHKPGVLPERAETALGDRRSG